MSWKLAPALIKLRDQVNAQWPNRSKDSDGSIGDPSHSARASDHNPNSSGIVCAIDITHDPRSGMDSYALAEILRASHDPRIEYIISNRKIASSHVSPWAWRKYGGSNPHDHHVHVSVRQVASAWNDTSDWFLDAKQMPAPVPIVSVTPPTLRRGSEGEHVEELQRLLGTKGIATKIDGDFGPATTAGVKRFQLASGLLADGVVGPQTWKALRAAHV